MLINSYKYKKTFSPLNIAGCKLWLDASKIAGLSDNDPVALWADASGNSNDATQAVGVLQPIYKTGVLNGLPVVRWDGSDDSLIVPDFLSGQSTAFVVGINSRIAVVEFMILQNSGTGYLIFLANANSGSNFWGVYLSNYGFVPSGETSSAFKVYTVRTDSSINVEMYTNGTLSATATSGVLYTGLTFSMIGNDQYNQVLNGDIAEIIVYDSALSSGDRMAVETYLSAKYAI